MRIHNQRDVENMKLNMLRLDRKIETMQLTYDWNSQFSM